MILSGRLSIAQERGNVYAILKENDRKVLQDFVYSMQRLRERVGAKSVRRIYKRMQR